MKNVTEASEIFDEKLPPALGLGRPTSDEGAPPVDDKILREYADNRLDEERALAVERLIARFASWHDAFERTALAEFEPKTR